MRVPKQRVAMTEPALLSLRAQAVEIKAFVPAKDFELSQQFYGAIGFERRSIGGGVAYYAFGETSFLLQDFYNKELAENLMMHLLVKDASAHRDYLIAADIPGRFGIKLTPLVTQPWRMVDFCLYDPSGVLWRIANNV